MKTVLILSVLSMLFLVGCDDGQPPTGDAVAELLSDTAEFLADTGALPEHEPMAAAYVMRTSTYYISNPHVAANNYTGCASAVRVQATGTGITSITLTNTTYTFDVLSSASTNSLVDTWFTQDPTRIAWDKDNSSSLGPVVFDTITVRVVNTTLTHLYYWFTDSKSCY
ncbi:MAG: hypothetical protein WCO25_00045 [Candidatus Uhrbacteria bacterium]